MPDDTVTTSWKRFTDRVKTSCDQSLHATLAPASGTPGARSPTPTHWASGLQLQLAPRTMTERPSAKRQDWLPGKTKAA